MLRCMRTTIRLDADLLRRTKALAAQTGRTFTAIVEDALRQSLARHRSGRGRARIKLPIFKGKGLRPGVDLDDSAGLLEIMEGRDSP
jgi:hypothetical protein